MTLRLVIHSENRMPVDDGDWISGEFDMAEITTDVLIVGSGPAGSACAALLSTYGVENMVVERKVVRRNDGDAEPSLTRPVRGAKPGSRLDQRPFIGCAGPEALQREFQLAARTDARRTESGDSRKGYRHGATP